jgi:cytochrome b6-f complex iron-sulfur subunit
VVKEFEPGHADESNEARRKAVEWLLGSSFLGLAFIICFPLLNILIPPKRTSEKNELIEVGPEGSVGDGSPKTVMGSDGVPIIVFLADGALKALEKKCPHLGCMVDVASNELDCPCHGARFTFDGKLIAGPSPRDLKQYKVVIREGKIFVGAEVS